MEGGLGEGGVIRHSRFGGGVEGGVVVLLEKSKEGTRKNTKNEMNLRLKSELELWVSIWLVN